MVPVIVTNQMMFRNFVAERSNGKHRGKNRTLQGYRSDDIRKARHAKRKMEEN